MKGRNHMHMRVFLYLIKPGFNKCTSIRTFTHKMKKILVEIKKKHVNYCLC